MLERTAATQKIMVLGIDALDPRIVRKYVDKGIMPNMKQYIERGACRQDLVLLGANPTVTPPQWATLSTGAYPMTHGITGFYRHSKTKIDVIEYNLDSRKLQAEQLWDVFVENGKKTLIFHWPGCSWPPTKEELYVVDGTNPGAACMSTNQVEANFIMFASERIKENKFVPKVGGSAAICVVEDLVMDTKEDAFNFAAAMSAPEIHNLITSNDFGQGGKEITPTDQAASPLKPAEGWANAPEDAMEFNMLFSGGLIRRPSLLIKNAEGKYDTVLMFKKKSDTEPMAVLPLHKYVRNVYDVAYRGDVEYRVQRSMVLMNVDETEEAGIRVRIYVSGAMDIENPGVFYPQSLFKTLGENVGYPTPTVNLFNRDKEIFMDAMIGGWYECADWQSGCINYMVENMGVEAIFSHFHSEDLLKHQMIQHMNLKYGDELPAETYQMFMEEICKLSDYYVGKYLHLLDEGWTIIITSDHAQVCSKHIPPYLGDVLGVNVRVMQELGYTVLKTDENGNELREIDWEKTKAVAVRENDIYINVKGRWDTGIVDPEDQYELEEQIMTDLYSYKDKTTGHRVVALAIRNRDAALLGLGGPESGDIIYFNAEGYNYDHADMLSTAYGEFDTSASPIFIAAGQGIKPGYTDRMIRQVDVAPTMAVLMGVRMPAQCEGAPVYQILEKQY